MAPAPGTYAIGPETGALQLRTSREGVAAKAGHDLLLTLTRWSGQLTVDDDPAKTRIEVDIELGSLAVLEGTGGVAALSDDDRKDITATALRLLAADQYPRAGFTSTQVSSTDDAAVVEGTLTLGGASVPVTVQVVGTGPTSWRGTATVLQSAVGIKPYRAFFGALRLADAVEVEVTVDLAGAEDRPPAAG